MLGSMGGACLAGRLGVVRLERVEYLLELVDERPRGAGRDVALAGDVHRAVVGPVDVVSGQSLHSEVKLSALLADLPGQDLVSLAVLDLGEVDVGLLHRNELAGSNLARELYGISFPKQLHLLYSYYASTSCVGIFKVE